MLLARAGIETQTWKSSTLHFTIVASQTRNLQVYCIVNVTLSKILSVPLVSKYQPANKGKSNYEYQLSKKKFHFIEI